MINWRKQRQRELKERLEKQSRFCKCGFPIPPMCRTLLDNGIFGSQFILQEYEYECPECYKKYIRIG